MNSKIKDTVSEEEWDARVELAALYRLVALYGWDDLVFTHISVRVPSEPEHFLLNPYGLLFDEICSHLDTHNRKILLDMINNFDIPNYHVYFP